MDVGWFHGADISAGLTRPQALEKWLHPSLVILNLGVCARAPL